MNISHEIQDDKVALLSISFTSDEVKDEVDAQLKKMRQVAQIPGFRPGKTPIAIIEKKYGKSIRYDVSNKYISNKIVEYLNEQHINVFGRPIITQDDNSYTPEQTDYTVEVSVGLLHDFPTNFDSSITLPYYNVKLGDKAVNDHITHAQQQFGNRTEVDDVQAKDMLSVSVREVDDQGNPLEEGLTLEETYLLVEYISDEKIREQLLQAHKGDKLTILLQQAFGDNEVEIASFLGIDRSEVKHHTAPVEIEIVSITRVTPHPIDEELCKSILGSETTVSTEEELREALQKEQDLWGQELSQELFTSVVKNFVIEQIEDIPFSDEHAKPFVIRNEEDTEETYAERVTSVIPFLRYHSILDGLLDKMQIHISEEDVRKTITKNIIERMQMGGMASLINVPGFLDRFVNKTIEEQNETYISALRNTKERMLADKVKELVTLDYQELTSPEQASEVQKELSERFVALLRPEMLVPEEEIASGAEQEL